MPITLQEALVRIRPDVSRFDSELTAGTLDSSKKAGEKAGHSFGDAMKKTVGIAAAGVAAIFSGGKLASQVKQAVLSANDLNETQNKAQVVFGASTKAINAFASTAHTALGQTTQQAIDGAANFAIFGKAAGLTGKNLVGFSTTLVKTAADMASFSNTTPQDAIEALNAALRGESDPIEKYGVLLNQQTLQARALSLGLVSARGSTAQVTAAQIAGRAALVAYNTAVKEHGKNSLEAQKAHAKLGLAEEHLSKTVHGTVPVLTSQQRVLAANAEIAQQLGVHGSKAIGDFARSLPTSFANQIRNVQAGFKDLRTTMGTSLLPVVLTVTQTINGKLIPALFDVWNKQGPQITAFFQRGADRIKTFVASGLSVQKVSGFVDKAGTSFHKLAPEIEKTFKQGGGLNDTWRVSSTLIKFFADHVDLLAKALPFLAAGYLIVKGARVASNVAETVSIPLRVGELIANNRLASSNRALAVSLVEQTGALQLATGSTVEKTVAETVSTGATKRGIVAQAASKVAMLAGAVATGIATAATWAFGAAMAVVTSPIFLVIAAIALIVGALILLFKHNKVFHDFVITAWKQIKETISGVAGWISGTLWPSLRKAFSDIGAIVLWLWRNVIVKMWAGVKLEFQIGWAIIRVIFTLLAAIIRVAAGVFLWFWRNVIQFAWRGIRLEFQVAWGVIKGIFDVFSGYIRTKVAPAFNAGIQLVKNIWNTLREAMKVPINIVIGFVNSGIIDLFNKVAGAVGAHVGPGGKGVPHIAKLAAGGLVPMQPMVTGGPTAIVGEGNPAYPEYVIPTDPKYATGAQKLWHAAGHQLQMLESGGILGFLSNPIGYVKGKLSGVGNVLGSVRSTPIGQILSAVVGKLGSALTDWVKSHLAFSLGPGIAGGGNLGGPSGNSVAAILAMARRFYPGAQVSSGYRPGDPGYHGKGEAADIIGGGVSGMNQIARGFYGMAGRLLELIHSPSWFVKNGRPVGADFYRSVFAEHFNHVHVAANRNALTGDSGGFLRPGWNMPIFNGTGRLEPFGGAGVTIQAGAVQIGSIGAGVDRAMVRDEVGAALHAFAEEINRGRRR